MTSTSSIPRELAALFEPQVEQLGIRLEQRGAVWAGEASNSRAKGSMWLCALSPSCLVLCHDLEPLEDMPLFEGSLGPYACACTMGDDAVACSQGCGLPLRFIESAHDGRRTRDEVATFVEQGPRTLSSNLLAHHVYRSRSFIMLPEFFDELDRRYPGEFRGLFPAFSEPWNRQSQRAIVRALSAIPTSSPLRPCEELGLLSNVTSLMASLAMDAARGPREDSSSQSLADQAKERIRAAIDLNEAPPTVDALARELYVSRSHLCAAFKRETGLAVGTYARHARMERAYRLLEDDALSVAEIAEALGYPSSSAFCHAFASAAGVSPRAWREA